MDLAARVVESLRERRDEVLAGREQEPARVVEVERSPVVLRVGVLWVLVEDELAAGTVPVSEALAVNLETRSWLGDPSV